MIDPCLVMTDLKEKMYLKIVETIMYLEIVETIPQK